MMGTMQGGTGMHEGHASKTGAMHHVADVFELGAFLVAHDLFAGSQMNAERQHLAAEKKPKRIRNKNTNKETDMGHYHKADYYVPKGRADNFSGMFVAKETGEML